MSLLKIAYDLVAKIIYKLYSQRYKKMNLLYLK